MDAMSSIICRYDQDGDTQVWHPELDQVENEVSPWELKVSLPVGCNQASLLAHNISLPQ